MLATHLSIRVTPPHRTHRNFAEQFTLVTGRDTLRAVKHRPHGRPPAPRELLESGTHFGLRDDRVDETAVARAGWALPHAVSVPALEAVDAGAAKDVSARGLEGIRKRDLEAHHALPFCLEL